ncbi:MAG: hypothetical protein LWW75_05060, partial [Chlorobiales bacterium]|nr:hypothetical protein [Chlorobiales bacterium]
LPRLRREFKDSLRQHLYYIEKYGPYEHLNKRGFESVWGMKRHIRGMIDYSKMVEPIYAKNMLAIYNAIDWPL